MVDLLGPALCPAIVAAMVILVLVAFDDFATRRIGDDRIVAIAILAMTARGYTGGLAEILAGLASGAVVFSVVLLVVSAHARMRGVAGMGGGDAKLLAVIAFLFGAASVGPVLMAAAGSAIVGIACHPAERARSITRSVPFAPHVVTAAIAFQVVAWVSGRPWQYWVVA